MRQPLGRRMFRVWYRRVRGRVRIIHTVRRVWIAKRDRGTGLDLIVSMIVTRRGGHGRPPCPSEKEHHCRAQERQ